MTETISIVTPVYNPPLRAWRQNVKSVLGQTDPNWRWVIVDDKSPDPRIRIELERLAKRDSRITVIFAEQNGGIVAASNLALNEVETEFVTFLDHDDALTNDAIAIVRDTIREHPEADVIYSDEDKIDRFGRHYDQTRKPVWSPEKLRGQMYIGHLAVYRTALVKKVGLLRPQCEGSQDHDLALRVTELAREVVRVPKVLYHWRVVPGSTAATADNKPYTWTAGLVAVQDHLKRTGARATADYGSHPSHYKITRDITTPTPVSVVVPTRGTVGTVYGKEIVFVEELLRSLIDNSGKQKVEYVIVHDAETPKEVLDNLKKIAGKNLTLVPYLEPFNFSRKCNVGALNASHNVIVFLNDDMTCISDNVLAHLVAPLRESGVGMTGAKLFFEDGSIQHGGHLHDTDDNRIAYYGAPANYPGQFGALIVNREASGVTGACIAMTKKVFEEVGGFSELFPNSYNDVDLCNKVRSRGYRILWLADVQLNHFESKSRVPIVAQGDYFNIHARWGRTADDFYA